MAVLIESSMLLFRSPEIRIHHGMLAFTGITPERCQSTYAMPIHPYGSLAAEVLAAIVIGLLLTCLCEAHRWRAAIRCGPIIHDHLSRTN